MDKTENILEEIEKKYSTINGNLIEEKDNDIKAVKICRKEFENVINKLEEEINGIELIWLPGPYPSEKYTNLDLLEEAIIKYKLAEKCCLKFYNIKMPKIYSDIINKKLEEKGSWYRIK